MAYSGSSSGVSVLWRLSFIVKYAPTARISARSARVVSGWWNEWWAIVKSNRSTLAIVQLRSFDTRERAAVRS